MSRHQDKFTLAERKEESLRVREKHPDRIPVIVQPGNNKIAPLLRTKYLVPPDLDMGQLCYIIRKKVSIRPEQALFVFVNGKLPPCKALVGDVYVAEKDEDGYLYVYYSGEDTFGYV